MTTSHLTEETTSQSTKPPKNGGKVAGYNPATTLGKSLVIAIPLSNQKTFAKWLVIAIPSSGWL